MEINEVKPLKERLLEAVNNILIENNASNLTNKMKKVVRKSIKKIAKKVNK